MTEKENHFLDLPCGSHEFFTVKAWMEKNMPEAWLDYTWDIKDNKNNRDAVANTINNVLNLSNLVAFLIEHRIGCGNCGGTGKVKHPALVWWDRQEEK